MLVLRWRFKLIFKSSGLIQVTEMMFSVLDSGLLRGVAEVLVQIGDSLKSPRRLLSSWQGRTSFYKMEWMNRWQQVESLPSPCPPYYPEKNTLMCTPTLISSHLSSLTHTHIYTHIYPHTNKTLMKFQLSWAGLSGCGFTQNHVSQTPKVYHLVAPLATADAINRLLLLVAIACSVLQFHMLLHMWCYIFHLYVYTHLLCFLYEKNIPFWISCSCQDWMKLIFSQLINTLSEH